MLAAVESVRCVEGCGGGNTVAIIGLVVALLSLGIALAAWRVSQDSLRIARREHQVFMDRLNARADFAVTLYLADRKAPEHVLEVTNPAGTPVRLKWQLGIENVGDKPADGALINFLLPAVATDPKWVTQTGNPIPDRGLRHGPMSTAEELVAENNSRHPAQYLIMEMDRVPLKGSRVAFASAAIPTPAVGDEVRVPVSFRIESDDLPDDVRERRIDLETTVRHVQ